MASNNAAPGPDRQTIDEVERHLGRIVPTLSRSLLDSSYQPGNIRRVWIPKTGGAERGLGIPNVIDRKVGQAVHQVLSPSYEPTFRRSSHGFRPERSCDTAMAEAKGHVEDGQEWVVDIDLERFLDPSSHCTPNCGAFIEQAGQSVRDSYSQAFASPQAYMNGVELAALYTLQDRLSRDPEQPCGLMHHHVAIRGCVHEARAELVRETDTPRCSWRQLLAADESIVEPPVLLSLVSPPQ